MAERTRESCPFCPERIETSTPTFTQLPYRRLRRGECWVFPNLFPFSKHHAVTVFTQHHFKLLKEITAEELNQGINVSLEFLRDIHQLDKAARYPILAWNYLPPAGASIIHPHFQIMVDERPTGIVGQEIEASGKFLSDGVCFWEELLEAERELGERMVKFSEPVSWVAGFSPLGNREVLAIFRGKSSLSDLTKRDVEEFVKGLAGVLRYYSDSGVMSVNMVFYSGPLYEDISRYFYLHARIVARPTPTTLYVSDDGFLEKLCAEPVIDMTPEDLAESLRRYLA